MRTVEQIELSLRAARRNRERWRHEAARLATELNEAREAERRVEVKSWGGATIEFSLDGCAALHLKTRRPGRCSHAEDCNLDPSAGKALKEFFNKNF